VDEAVKIGIVTLYDAPNYGAFLQAYALQEILEGMGHHVEFLPFRNIEPPEYVIWTLDYGRVLYNLINFKRIIYQFRRRRAIKKCLSKLNIARNTSQYYDVVILGSDEIWNLNSVTFNHYPEYFGNNINTGNLITYAPDCGNTPIQELAADENAINGLKRINRISARSQHTAEAVKTITGKNVPLVLDPALLLGDFSIKTKKTK
jgi:hypothetical protein